MMKMMSESIEVPRAELSYEFLWAAPRGVIPVPLCRAIDGGSPRLATRVALFHDRSSLYVLFSGDDDAVQASHLDRDAPLYEEDVVEVFLAPSDPTIYFEFEVNPLGTLFDARVVSPDGNRATMTVDRAWNASGLWAASRRGWSEGRRSAFETLVAIPLLELSSAPPRPGEAWRANFFRIDRSAAGDEYSSWRPTRRNPPDFHVPSAFGTIIFA